eukprot:TRINITY_DN3680_c0_g1_i2.p1 TRINITY_DN3680_c0_g1~~TRINITY_DN3680_c0_g1_i2.p1  ORF type:complete len:367 (-),score=98.51 TRINITY_DN3680_c0_g1_i2:117-1217(-)
MSESSSSSNNDEFTLVCVTGAGGFIGTHVVRELLESGKYRVRATLRDANDEQKVKHLKELKGAENLELFSADLTKPGSYDDVVRGVKFVFHVAAAVTMTADNPQRDIVDVGVEGTRNVFSAVEKSQDTVKRVIMTSSIAAIGKMGAPNGTVWTENDWNDTADVKTSPYPLEKYLSEKLSLEMVKDKPYDVVHINPGLVLGPVYTEIHIRSSPTVIRDIITGKIPLCPRLSMPIVHINDVVKAHIYAAERSDPSHERYIPGGSRFILALPQTLWWIDMARILHKAFPQYPVPQKEMWDWVMYAYGMFDKRVSWGFLDNSLGKITHYSNEKAIKELGIEFHDAETSLVDTVKSFIDRGFIPNYLNKSN